MKIYQAIIAKQKKNNKKKIKRSKLACFPRGVGEGVDWRYVVYIAAVNISMGWCFTISLDFIFYFYFHFFPHNKHFGHVLAL